MSGSINAGRVDHSSNQVEPKRFTDGEIAQRLISGEQTPNEHEIDAHIRRFRAPARHGDVDACLALGIVYLWRFKRGGLARSVEHFKIEGKNCLNTLVVAGNVFARELWDQFDSSAPYQLPSVSAEQSPDGLTSASSAINGTLTDTPHDLSVDITAEFGKKLQELFDLLAKEGVPESARLRVIVETAAEWLRAQRHDAVAETTRRKAQKPKAQPETLSSPPRGLSWPTETYSGSPEAMRGGGGIIAYLERVWLPVMEANPGTVDLRTLRAVDPSAASGINNFGRHGRMLPPHIDIPTKREVNDRTLVEDPTILLRDHRLAQVVANRMRRGARMPPTPR